MNEPDNVEMIRPIDVRREASSMIEVHGDQAEMEATMKAAHMLATGDRAGWEVWKKIAEAIAELRGKAREPTHTKH